MTIIYFLIGCSIALAIFFLVLFFWTQKNGQNDDLYTPSVRMLFDDEEIAQMEAGESKKQVN